MTVPLIAAAAVGALLGLSLFTFGYARGWSYLTNDPQACANCHVMREQLNGWRKASHRQAAVCNDCHTPPGFAAKYGTKALNGLFHSWAFTTGRFPDHIRITERNRAVTESACLKCHADITDALRGSRTHSQAISCLRCHNQVGHQ